MNAICRLCDKFVITTYAVFDSGTMVVGLPAGEYLNGEKYCIVFNQDVPAGATVNAPVVFTIGSDATQYPFLDKCGRAMTASMIQSRSRYATHVLTTPTSGAFRWDGKCYYGNRLRGIGGE